MFGKDTMRQAFKQRQPVELDKEWLRAHLPKDCRRAQIDRWFRNYYLDGLKVMFYGERGNPDKIVYEAKNEEDLKWWQLDHLCNCVGKIENTGTWRWYRDHCDNGRWYYIEHRHYDYNAIEDLRLPGFERYLRNLKYAFPEDYFRKKVDGVTALMNRWYLVPHWGYDYENLRFIEISDSKEYSSDSDKTEKIKPDNVIRMID